MTVESSGDARVDLVVGRLEGVGELDLPGQLAAFSQVHAELAAVLDAEPTTVAIREAAASDLGTAPSSA